MMNTFRKISIDFSTYFLILVALLAGYIKNVFIILTIVIFHELGHIFFLYLFNIEIESIKLYPYGGMTTINKRLHERIYKDILISLGGLISQMLLYFIFFYLYQKNIIVKTTYEIFVSYNKSIILFNLIPIIPLDGSKLIFSIYSKFFSYKKSYLLMIITGIISLSLFMTYNFIYKLNDIILYSFLVIQLFHIIKEYNLVMNKFYLERLMYNNYYNQIISDVNDISKIRIDKYYYFKENNHYVNEKDYIRKIRY